ncbi:MAG: antirestriction protein ArdA [Pseudomonadota bacterium]
MTLQLHAQPYDLAAAGFYFETYEDYAEKAAKLQNDYGEPVEEFEIQFIDGEHIDCDLAKAIGINQANLKQYFEAVEDWDDHDKTRVILAVGECGYSFDDNIQPQDFDLDIYECDSLRDLAEQFVDEGLFGDIPERLQFYLDYDAIARDLGMDYAEATVAGKRLIYRCG